MSLRPGAGQLRILTLFLVGVFTLTVVSLLVDTSSSPTRPAGAPTPAEAAAVTTTTATPPPTTTTTTTLPAPPETTTTLRVKDEVDIELDVAPSVGFVTTRNGTGSGVLVDDHLMVTNAHVVWPFRTVSVVFPGDHRRSGKVLGIDPRADLAVVELDGDSRLPPPLPIGSAKETAVGTVVYVVGYPLAGNDAPAPTVASGLLRGVLAWEFSGVDWAVVDAPAIAGQSGGALVDEYGRLIGITTFGDPEELYAAATDDLRAMLRHLVAGSDTDVEQRRPPEEGSRRRHEMSLEGPWDQVIYVAWLGPNLVSNLTSSETVRWRAVDPFGVEIATGTGALEADWLLASPGVVLGEADLPVETVVSVDLPLTRLVDPDDAGTIVPGETLEGFFDVPGDRDFFYLDLDEEGSISIAVEAQSRVRIGLHRRDTGEALAAVEHRRGFLFPEPTLDVEGLTVGGYVVTVEDIGAQYGTYRVDLSW